MVAWIIEHWPIVLSIAVPGGFVIKFLYGLWNSRESALLAKATREKMKLDSETRSVAQVICIHVESIKMREGTNDLIFSTDELREALEERAIRFHAAIDLLVSEGRAKKARIPGCWIID